MVEVHKQITAEEIAHTFEEEAPKGVDFSQYAFEDWLTLIIFWVMALSVFLQFFTRYVLNDSYAWTEEIATYCLIGVVFLGSSMCVRLSRHIQVDLLFRYLPHTAGRALSTVIDLIRIAFFGYAIKLVWIFIQVIGDEEMTTVKIPEELCLLRRAARLRPDVCPFDPDRGRELASRLFDTGAPRRVRRNGRLTPMLLLLGAFLVLMLLGLPVALAMATSSLLYILVTGITPDVTLAQRMIAGVESFPLLAVPFFILAGNLMNIAGVTGRIYSFAVALVGWMRGGLGHVNIVGSVIFSGMSGTAIADAAGLGTIEIKAMKDHGYSTEFSVGVTAASATLGPIIPPSLPFVIYGMMANVSIGALFLGGVIPGVVMTLMMMATVAYFAHKNGWGSDTPFSWRQVGSAGLEIVIVLAFPLAVWLMVLAGLSTNMAVGIGLVVLLALDWYFDFSAVMALMAPVILIGGMTLGWFTPTEAAVAAVIWSLFLGLVRYRSMTLQTVAKATFDTIETTASVLFIVTAASIFAWLLTVSQAAQILTDAMLGITQNKWVFLLLANILILFVGCFIDTIAAITILVPILLPIVLKLGIDPIHFGLIMTLNLMIGLLHPPLGMVLFVLARVAKLSVERTTMAILPWLVPLLLALVAITYIPELTLWLPKYMGLAK